MPLCFTEMIFFAWSVGLPSSINTEILHVWKTPTITHSNLLKEEALSSKRKASMPAMLYFLQMMHLFALAMNFCKRRRGCGVTSFKGVLSWDSCILKMRFLFSCMGSQNANVYPFAKEYLTCCAMCIEGTRWNKTFLKICHTLSQRSWYLKQKFHALCAWSAARARWKTQFRFVETVPFWRNIAGCKISENVTKDQRACLNSVTSFASVLVSNCLTLPTALLPALCVALLLSFSDTFYSWIPQTHNSSETVANQYTKMSIKYVCRYLDLRKDTNKCPFPRFLPLGRISCEGAGNCHFLIIVVNFGFRAFWADLLYFA